jgi:hypothetical protein
MLRNLSILMVDNIIVHGTAAAVSITVVEHQPSNKIIDKKKWYIKI